MNNDLILRRTLSLQTWHVQGTVWKVQKREEILLVLKFLAEFPNDNAKTLAEHLLFEAKGRKAVAERLLRISESYGLVEKDRYRYSLTEQGWQALNKEEIPVPEEGFWKIIVSDDPLLPHPLVAVEPLPEPNIQKELLGGKDKKDALQERTKNIKKLPELLTCLQKGSLNTHYDNQNLWLKSLEGKGEFVKTELKLLVEWNVDKNSIRFLENNKVKNQWKFEKHTKEKIWTELLCHNDMLDDWDEENNRLKVCFDDLNGSERKRMKSDITFRRPALGALKQFDDLTVQDIDIYPCDHANAQQWAEWLLHESINDFCTCEDYQKLSEQAAGHFTADYSIGLPDRDAFAKTLWHTHKQQRKTWYAVASADWNL